MNIFEKYPRSEFLKGCVDPQFTEFTERLNELYECFAGLEDRHFGSELDIDPYSRLWEMMVAKIIKDSGYKPESANKGPDFWFLDTVKVFIEAVCPEPGDENKPDSVPIIDPNSRSARRVPIDQIVMRITGAIKTKKSVYERYLLDGTVRIGDPCIIAVNSSKIIGGKNMNPPIPLRAVLGYGNAYALYERDVHIRNGIDYNGHIVKRGGAAIDTTIFLRDDYKMISALLYSDSSLFSSYYDLTKGVLLIHNPMAEVPLRPHLFPQTTEIWTIRCNGEDIWRSYKLNPDKDNRGQKDQTEATSV